MQRFKIRYVFWVLGLSLLSTSLLIASRELTTTDAQTGISTVFITITNGHAGGNYVLVLQGDSKTKDQISGTLDGPTTNLNYTPPPGITINPNDKICILNTNVCSFITPESFGTGSVTLRLP